VRKEITQCRYISDNEIDRLSTCVRSDNYLSVRPFIQMDEQRGKCAELSQTTVAILRDVTRRRHDNRYLSGWCYDTMRHFTFHSPSLDVFRM